jgi:hypothetical protein
VGIGLAVGVGVEVVIGVWVGVGLSVGLGLGVMEGIGEGVGVALNAPPFSVLLPRIKKLAIRKVSSSTALKHNLRFRFILYT